MGHFVPRKAIQSTAVKWTIIDTHNNLQSTSWYAISIPCLWKSNFALICYGTFSNFDFELLLELIKKLHLMLFAVWQVNLIRLQIAPSIPYLLSNKYYMYFQSFRIFSPNANVDICSRRFSVQFSFKWSMQKLSCICHQLYPKNNLYHVFGWVIDSCTTCILFGHHLWDDHAISKR